MTNGLASELDALRDVIRRLDCAAIAYMLTGSLAMNYYSVPRMTRDIDLVVELKPSDVKRIVTLFTPDYYISDVAVAQAITRQSVFNIIHQASIVKIDFIIRKSSEYRRVEFARRQLVVLADLQLWIVSQEDLILSKLIWAQAAHSDYQLRDVRNLLATGYDAEYVNLWARQLKVDALLGECLNAGYDT